MRNTSLDDSQAGIKIPGRNINNLRYSVLWMAEIKEKLKSLLMKVKSKEWENWLKTNIHKTKIMASSPTTSWQIKGKSENSDRF